MKAAGEGGRTAGSWDWRRMGDGLRQESMDKNRNHVSRRFDPNRESSRCPRRVVKPNTWIAPAADRTDVTNQRRGLIREEIWYTETENMVDVLVNCYGQKKYFLNLFTTVTNLEFDIRVVQ